MCLKIRKSHQGIRWDNKKDKTEGVGEIVEIHGKNREGNPKKSLGGSWWALFGAQKKKISNGGLERRGYAGNAGGGKTSSRDSGAKGGLKRRTTPRPQKIGIGEGVGRPW